MNNISGYPLAIIAPTFGSRSETFIYQHMHNLLPNKTAIIVRDISVSRSPYDSHIPILVLKDTKKSVRWAYDAAKYLIRAEKHTPYQLALKNYLEVFNVEVVLSHYLDYSLRWLNTVKDMGKKFFAHAHGYDVSKALLSPKTRERYKLLQRADGIITVSHYSKNILIDLGLKPEKIHVIPCGVNPANTFPKRDSRKPVQCIAVGRMVQKKSPIHTLDAFYRATLQYPRMRLDYIGSGELLDEAKSFVQSKMLIDKVTLHGEQPNEVVWKLLSRADIFLQHSRTDPISGDEEGLPVAILEAMGSGLPVVTTRHAGIPEAVIDGATGYLVDEGDTKRMANHIVNLAANPELRERLGIAGWQRVRSEFSWQIEREKLLELLGIID